MLVLPFVESKEYEFKVASDGITFPLNFIRFYVAVLELELADRQTDIVSPIYVHFGTLCEECIMIFKNSVRTAKKTPHFTITTINWLTVFKEIIAVYSENRTELINTPCGEMQTYCSTIWYL
jgi:hypothetical protein